MKTRCDLVSEHVALGEPLGEHAAHAASCATCQRTIAMPKALGASHNEVDPGLGFAARMTVGAQHLVVARRRRRVVLGLAATVAAGSLGVFAVTRSPSEPTEAPAIAHQPTTPDQPTSNQPDDDVTALVHLADTDRNSHLGASWGRIEQPLRPYRAVLKGLLP